MIVTPKLIPVRNNGTRYLPGEEFEISRAGYERISEHLEVVDESDFADNELNPEEAAIRERGKELGIKQAHRMGIEKLTTAIAEKEAELAKAGDPNAGNNE